MGLDMSLYATEYVGSRSNKEGYDHAVKALGAEEFFSKHSHDRLGSADVKVEVAYWRKANAIHKYFVDNLQGGKDECQTTEVSRSELQDLLDICNEVMEDRSKAEKLLPTQGGFFFGSTEYDEYYFENIEMTINQLTSILENAPKRWYFEYSSSW
jgi:hypothetical protein